MPGAESQTAALAKIGADSSGVHGILLWMLPKGPFSEYLRRCSPLPAFLCGTPEMRWKKTFLPPDFGGAHPSDPRLQVQFYAYYFRDTTLLSFVKRLGLGGFGACRVVGGKNLK